MDKLFICTLMVNKEIDAQYVWECVYSLFCSIQAYLLPSLLKNSLHTKHSAMEEEDHLPKVFDHLSLPQWKNNSMSDYKCSLSTVSCA
jgi:hypothetical protein